MTNLKPSNKYMYTREHIKHASKKQRIKSEKEEKEKKKKKNRRGEGSSNPLLRTKIR